MAQKTKQTDIKLDKKVLSDFKSMSSAISESTSLFLDFGNTLQNVLQMNMNISGISDMAVEIDKTKKAIYSLKDAVSSISMAKITIGVDNELDTRALAKTKVDISVNPVMSTIEAPSITAPTIDTPKATVIPPITPPAKTPSITLPKIALPDVEALKNYAKEQKQPKPSSKPIVKETTEEEIVTTRSMAYNESAEKSSSKKVSVSKEKTKSLDTSQGAISMKSMSVANQSTDLASMASPQQSTALATMASPQQSTALATMASPQQSTTLASMASGQGAFKKASLEQSSKLDFESESSKSSKRAVDATADETTTYKKTTTKETSGGSDSESASEPKSAMTKAVDVVGSLNIAGTAKDMFSTMFTTGTELETAQVGFDRAFADMGQNAQTFIDEFQTMTPMTEASAKTMASGIQNMLLPMGFASAEATTLTGDTFELVGALTNYSGGTQSAEQVAGAFQQALGGNYEALAGVGIQLDEQTVKEEAVRMGLASTTSEVSSQAQAQAMLSLAQAQSSDALSAYSEENLTASSRLDIMKTSINDAFAEAGQSLLPKVSEIFSHLQGAIPIVTEAIGGVGSAFSIVGDVILIIFDVLGGLGGLLEPIFGSIPLLESIGPIVAGIALVFGVLALALGIVNLASTIYAGILAVQAIGAAIASAAQWVLNSALLACPITWIVIGIALLIMYLYRWIQSVGGLKIAWLIVMDAILTAWDSVKLGISTGIMHIINAFLGMKSKFLGISVAIQNLMGDMKAGTLMILEELVNGAIDRINDFITAVNNVTGASIKTVAHVTFGTNAKIANNAEKVKRNVELTKQQTDIQREKMQNVIDRNNQANKDAEEHAARQSDIANAKNEAENSKNSTEEDIPVIPGPDSTDIPGADIPTTPFGANMPMGGGFDPAGMSEGIANTAQNTGEMKDTLNVSKEDIKYMIDIADRDAINKYTTAAITIEQTNNNKVKSEIDLDGITNYLTEGLNEAIDTAVEGVYA